MTVQRLQPFETKDVVSLQTFTAGVHIQYLYTEGHALLSTVFVDTISGSVSVKYFDRSTGQDNGEATLIQTHTTITTPTTSDRKVVSLFHNKPYIEITVVGTARLGVTITLLASVSGSFEGVTSEGSVASLGLIAAAEDIDTSLVKFLKMKGNRLLTDLRPIRSAISGRITVGTSAIEAKVGVSALSNRSFVRIHNDSSSVVYWSFDPLISSSGATKGETIEKKQSTLIEAINSLPVYLISGSAGNSVLIHEGSAEL